MSYCDALAFARRPVPVMVPGGFFSVKRFGNFDVGMYVKNHNKISIGGFIMMVRVADLAEEYGMSPETFRHLLWRMDKRLPENHRPIRSRGMVHAGSFRAALTDYEKLTRRVGRRMGPGGRFPRHDGGWA